MPSVKKKKAKKLQNQHHNNDGSTKLRNTKQQLSKTNLLSLSKSLIVICLSLKRTHAHQNSLDRDQKYSLEVEGKVYIVQMSQVLT